MTRDEFRRLLVAEFYEEWAISYFDRSDFTEGAHPILYPWSYVANDKFRRDARRFLEREGVKLGAPTVKHLQPKTRLAAE
jgi:hypothetical protein